MGRSLVAYRLLAALGREAARELARPRPVKFLRRGNP